MNKSNRVFLGALALCVAAVFVIHHAFAQDMAKVHKGSKVVLENEQVRILETTLQPGEKTGMHSHPNHVVYAITGGKSKSVTADGKTTDLEIKAGEARWMDAMTHNSENVGQGVTKVLVIELKGKK